MAEACTCRLDATGQHLTCPACYQALLNMQPYGAFPQLWHAAPPALPPAATSSQLQARIHAVARRLGGWQRFTVRRSDKAQVAAGFPDDLYVGHGRLLLIEYKNEKEKVTLAQQGWLMGFWFHDPHAECYIGYPSDEARLVALLKGPAPQPRDEQWMSRLPHPVAQPVAAPVAERK
ncbi:MAG TPA: hypothetical protein VF077_12405 [Nitrospiraceae bacterium]